MTTPPISAAEVYTTVTGKADWTNELPKSPFDYDLRSRYAAVGGADGYLCTKEEELDEITPLLRAVEELRMANYQTGDLQHCLG